MLQKKLLFFWGDLKTPKGHFAINWPACNFGIQLRGHQSYTKEINFCLLFFNWIFMEYSNPYSMPYWKQIELQLTKNIIASFWIAIDCHCMAMVSSDNYKSFIIFSEVFKGQKISESFSNWLHTPKKMPNHYPELWLYHFLLL